MASITIRGIQDTVLYTDTLKRRNDMLKPVGTYTAWDYLMCGLTAVEEFRTDEKGVLVRLSNNEWYYTDKLEIEPYFEGR